MVRFDKPTLFLKIVVQKSVEIELPKSSLRNPQIPQLLYAVQFTVEVGLSVAGRIFFRLFCSSRWNSLPRDLEGFDTFLEESHRRC